MTHDEASQKLAAYWLALADESLASARSEQLAGRGHFATNRSYYACFYAASAVLLRRNLKFVRHSAVRDAVYRHLVHTGQIDADFGRVYGSLFTARQEADYGELVQIDADTAQQTVQSAEAFVVEMKRLIAG